MTQRPGHGIAQLILTLALLLCLLGPARARGGLSPSDFVGDLLSRYGDNTTISIPQLRALLSNFSVGTGHNSSGEWLPRASVTSCLAWDTLLGAHNLNEKSQLDERDLKDFCPAILQQLSTGACREDARTEPGHDVPSEGGPSTAEVWGFSVLSVTLVSAFSLTGVFVVPCMKTCFVRRVLVYFIALSIGALFSTAVFQLLPEVQ